jgi:hypothetical protein
VETVGEVEKVIVPVIQVASILEGGVLRRPALLICTGDLKIG